MDDDYGVGQSIALGLMVAFMVLVCCFGLIHCGHTVGYEKAEKVYQQQSIERGYGIHDGQTGDWKWIGEEEE